MNCQCMNDHCCTLHGMYRARFVKYFKINAAIISFLFSLFGPSSIRKGQRWPISSLVSRFLDKVTSWRSRFCVETIRSREKILPFLRGRLNISVSLPRVYSCIQHHEGTFSIIAAKGGWQFRPTQIPAGIDHRRTFYSPIKEKKEEENNGS